METARLGEYTESECRAYKEIAGYKWPDGFECGNCGGTGYFEGKKPYSRRCSKCKTDESPTAGTVFDKMRMPMDTALLIVRKLCSQDRLYNPTSWNEHIERNTGLKLNNKPVEEFLLKVYVRMAAEHEKLSGEVVIVEEGEVHLGVDGSGFHIASDRPGLKSFVRRHTTEDSLVVVYSYVPYRRSDAPLALDSRAPLARSAKECRALSVDFRDFKVNIMTKTFNRYRSSYLNYWNWIRNNRTYEELMPMLVREVPNRSELSGQSQY